MDTGSTSTSASNNINTSISIGDDEMPTTPALAPTPATDSRRTLNQRLVVGWRVEKKMYSYNCVSPHRIYWVVFLVYISIRFQLS